MKNPRLSHFPFHSDYVVHKSEFFPFVMFSGERNYTSPTVSSDRRGLRNQLTSHGTIFSLDSLSISDKAIILTGGSTAFGVGASSDRNTIASTLTNLGFPTLSFGTRGALLVQEFLNFSFVLREHSQIERVVVLSGVNDASLIFQDDEPVDWLYGGFFGSKESEIQTTLGSFELLTNTRLRKSFSWLLRQNARSFPQERPMVRQRGERFDDILGVLGVALSLWDNFSRSTGIRVDYVLQPVVGWTKKPLVSREQQRITADFEMVPQQKPLVEHDFYLDFKDSLQKKISTTTLNFYDANVWFDDLEGELFSDICHLTDLGYELLSRMLLKELELSSRLERS